MTIPNWYETVLLSLAAFRTWKLLAEDDITDKARGYITRSGGWKKEGDPLPPGYRYGLAEFVSCWWCFGFWIGLGWWGLWEAWPHGTLVASAPLAISALLALVGKAAD